MYAVIHGQIFVKQKRLPIANRFKSVNNMIYNVFSKCYTTNNSISVMVESYISLDRSVFF